MLREKTQDKREKKNNFSFLRENCMIDKNGKPKCKMLTSFCKGS
jgi:hypothetical protein